MFMNGRTQIYGIELPNASQFGIGSSAAYFDGMIEQKIDESYVDIGGVIVTAWQSLTDNSDLVLGLSDDGNVHVRGLTGREPGYNNGRLFVHGLEGRLELPKNKPHLDVNIAVSARYGDVVGDVAHRGRITTLSPFSDIRLRIHEPLGVQVRFPIEDGERVTVRGMVCKGGGLYTPPKATPRGILHAETSGGNIDIDYLLKE